MSQVSLNYCLKHPDAVPPKKTRESDSGYDLTLISKEEKVYGVSMYDTGVSFEPPPGYYLDFVPRSSLYKQGYFLVNSIGIIDNSYRGTVRMLLKKLDPSVPDLKLPACVGQVIPRLLHHFPLVEKESLTDTLRGENGFGSTG